MRDVLRTQHYAIRTENAYVDWARRFILFHQKRHPAEMGRVEIEAFLTHLAVERHVAASTQNQALSALLFLYKEVLRQEVGSVDAVRARKPKRLPTVLTKPEALRMMNAMVGVPQVMAKLLYGSGVRGFECVRVKQLHIKELVEGYYGAVYLPYALERKYPSANREWGWQYVFPAKSRSVDPRTGAERRRCAGAATAKGVRKTPHELRAQPHDTQQLGHALLAFTPVSHAIDQQRLTDDIQ